MHLRVPSQAPSTAREELPSIPVSSRKCRTSSMSLKALSGADPHSPSRLVGPASPLDLSSHHYQILIRRAGKKPLRLSFRPLPVLLGFAVLLSVPLAWLGTSFYWLQQSNHQISEAASEALEELEVLDEEIDELRQRAGLPEDKQRPKTQPQGGKGGPAIELDTEAQVQVVKRQVPVLARRLNSQVKPALEKTLQVEAAMAAARPQGKPTKGPSPISSDFGLRPGPFGGTFELHDGIDLLGPHGSPIYATANGRVEKAEYSGGYGYHVVLKHGYGYETLYAHLSKLAVPVGAQVKRGQIIGYMGSTGRSTGTHLHYSVRHQGEAIDPKPYMVSPQYAQK